MRIFMIDLENVRSSGLEGVLSLDKTDTVFIFYSDNAYNLTIPTLESINNSKATVKYIKTNYLGANAMDFQIVSLYGAMIERYKNGFFYIISHDHGFRSAVSFCQAYFESYDIHVGVYDNILAAITAELKELTSKNVPSRKSPQDNAPAGNSKSKKKSGKKKAAEQNREKADADTDPEADETALVDGQPEDTADQATSAVPKKKRRRRHKSSKSQTATQTQEGADTPTEAVKTPEPADVNAEKYRYMYRILGELLSEKTIDIYAEGIHKAVLHSSNKDELHSYFKKKYGDDEGEALFRVVQSDFEEMKKLAK